MKKRNEICYNMLEIKIGVSGFIKSEVEDGLSYLLEEFKHRPWVLNPVAYWDELSKRLIISVRYNVRESDIEGIAMDEVWDCVIATINFQEKISFEILKS